MQISKIDNSHNNFQGRCPEILMGQKAIHIISSYYPHSSATRFGIIAMRQEEKMLRDEKSFFNKIPQDKYNNMLLALNKLSTKINKIREKYFSFTDFHEAINTIRQLKNNKIGNCYESALLADTILKINGFKQSYITGLRTEDSEIDHVVCVFDKNKKNVDSFVTRDTIIIDPWVGICDFANNVFLHYKTFFKDVLDIDEDSYISLFNTEKKRFSKQQIEKLKIFFPDLIF